MEFDYTVFQLQQQLDSERKVYSQIPQESEDDLLVIHKYKREEEELEPDLIALAEHFPEIKSALTFRHFLHTLFNLYGLFPLIYTTQGKILL